MDYKTEQFKRLLDSTTDLYKREDALCKSKCHEMDSINCIFCYCPLYTSQQSLISENKEKVCGGSGVIIQDRKGNPLLDCSNCILPHTEDFIKKYLKYS